jgi:hypothetical protein
MQIIDTASLVRARQRLRNASTASAITAVVYVWIGATAVYGGDWSMLAAVGLGVFFAGAVIPWRRANKVFAGLCAPLFAVGFALLVARYGFFDYLVLFAILFYFMVQGARTAFGRDADLLRPPATRRRVRSAGLWSAKLSAPRLFAAIALAVGSLLALLSGIVLLLTQSVVLLPWLLELRREIPGGDYTVNLVAFALLGVSVLAYRRARQHLAPSGDQIQARDDRPPVLLLRSFGDDMIHLVGEQWRSFEEILTKQLWQIGPVVAIGRPGEPLPPLGAAREYVSNEAWQERLKELTDAAQLIVLIPGRTEGIRWEIRRILSVGKLSRAVIVVPPLSDEEIVARISEFGSELSDASVLDGAPLDRLLMLLFPDGREPVGLIGRHRMTRYYSEAIVFAAGATERGLPT